MRSLCLLLAGLTLSACGSGVLFAPWSPATEPGWTQEGGSSAGNGLHVEGVEPPLRLLWQQEVGKPPLRSPQLAGRLLLQWTKAPDLLVLDVATGRRLGRKGWNDPVCGAPALVGDRLMLTAVLDDDEPHVQAFDLASGDVRWRLDGAVCAGVAVRGDTAFVAFESGRVQAIDTADGSMLWTLGLERPLGGTPSLSGNHLYLPDGAGGIVAARVDSGTVAWRRAMQPPVRLRVAVEPHGERVYAVGDSHVQALSASTGDSLWQQSFDGLPGGVYATDAIVVVSSTDYGLHAFDPVDGAPRWHTELGGILRAAPVGTATTLYAGAADGWLYAVAVEDGAIVWRQQLDGPVLTGAALTPTLVAATTERGTTYLFGSR